MFWTQRYLKGHSTLRSVVYGVSQVGYVWGNVRKDGYAYAWCPQDGGAVVRKR